VRVPSGPFNHAGVGSSRPGNRRDRGPTEPGVLWQIQRPRTAQPREARKRLPVRSVRRREAEPRKGRGGWVGDCFCIRVPEIGRTRDRKRWGRGNPPAHHPALGSHPSDVTGGWTFDTNLGRRSAAGGGPPGARTGLRVIQRPRAGSGGRVGAGGSRAANGQGSSFTVGALTGGAGRETTTKALTDGVPLDDGRARGPSLGWDVAAARGDSTGRWGAHRRRADGGHSGCIRGPPEVRAAQPPVLGNRNREYSGAAARCGCVATPTGSWKGNGFRWCAVNTTPL
jgi:hypothetical protein